MYLYSVLILGP